MKGHSSTLVVMGAFLLWFGFYGFNPGGSLTIATRVSDGWMGGWVHRWMFGWVKLDAWVHGWMGAAPGRSIPRIARLTLCKSAPTTPHALCRGSRAHLLPSATSLPRLPFHHAAAVSMSRVARAHVRFTPRVTRPPIPPPPPPSISAMLLFRLTG